MNLYKIEFKNKTIAYRVAETEMKLLEKQKNTENLGFVVDKVELIRENVPTQ